MNTENEIWKDVPEYEDLYQVSNLGRVKSLNYNRTGKEQLIKSSPNPQGYLVLVLTKNGKSKTRTVHQLVAQAFLNHKPCGYKAVINHKDLNRQNNLVENLEIVSVRENANQKHLKSKSSYVGVYKCNKTHKWKAQIRIGSIRKHLGTFTDEIEAAKAYEQAVLELNEK